MNPSTHPNVIYSRGNYALLNPAGALAKVNKYTVAYIVHMSPTEDRPILLFYRKNRKEVVMADLSPDQYDGSAEFVDFTHIVTVALEYLKAGFKHR